jgi:phenylacetate-CoA ligase
MGQLVPRVLDAAERLDRDALRALQGERLAQTVQRAHRSPLYRKDLSEWLGFAPSEDVAAYRPLGLDDLDRLPITTKADLRAAGNIEDVLAVPLENVRRWHTSSGTTGRRTPMGYSEADMVNWGRLIQRNLAATGIMAGSRVHNAYGYGLFTGGLGFETGLGPMGATVLPASSVPDVEQHLELMHQHRAQALLSTPGLALALAEAVERNPALRPPELQAGIFGGDGWSPALRRHIEVVLGIRAHDTYGLSEVLGPGVAHACDQGEGLHLYEDAFLPEVLDPVDGVPLTPGTDGELVLTTLLNEASPRLRYRTGDRVRIERERCPCGRTAARLINVVRADDVRLYAGRALAPNDIEAALLRMDAVAPTFRVVAPGRELDVLRLEVEPKASPPQDFERSVRGGMESVLDVPVEIRVLASGSLERSRGKRLRLVDEPWRAGGSA